MDVKLYVYDLTGGMARMMSQQLLGTQIDAVYHTAIVLENIEYFFGAGIQQCRAGSTHHGRPMEIISLGTTQLPMDVIQEYFRSLREIYTAESYDLFAHNCNNFSHDVAMFLLGKGIPEHITNLPQKVLDTPFGQMLRPQIDASMRSITQAPLLNEQHTPLRAAQNSAKGVSLPLLKLGRADAVSFRKSPPIDKLSAKLGDIAKESAFAQLIKFIRDREGSPKDAPLPEMSTVCKAYQALATSLPLENRFAAVDLLRYASLDVRLCGYFGEENKQSTIMAIVEHVLQLEETCPHNLRLVTVQLLCNCFAFHLFYKASLSTQQQLPQLGIQLITSSLLDEAHITSRVAAAWLAFNLTDAAYRLKEEGKTVFGDDLQVELAASIIERLQSEENEEAVKALLLTLGRLLTIANGDDLSDLTTALDAKRVLASCRVEKQLAQEVSRLL